MDSNSKILVAGANGMVGSAIVRNLKSKGYTNIVLGTRNWVNFAKEQETKTFFEDIKPEYVFLAAAKVGGIMANRNYQADFITENLQIQTNIIQQSHLSGVKKLLFLGSSCIYPKYASQPISEDQLMTGLLEPTNDAYAIAKIAGIKMCQAYRHQYGFNAISLMPSNLYGPNDNFDLNSSHVLPALIRKFDDGKNNIGHDDGRYYQYPVILWGDGSPMREFLHVDDLADACLFLMLNYNDPDIINVGTGTDITIKELATIISNQVGFTGKILWDTNKPNGTPKKVLDISKIKSLGWNPKINLTEGIKKTYEWYRENIA